MELCSSSPIVYSDAPKKKKAGKGKGRKKIEGKKNSDDEAVEESDSMDEGAEVDYMTSSDRFNYFSCAMPCAYHILIYF
jgi:hypothetical protein